jgi:alpha-tubulin suppressor-like RCC1 family protein
MRSFPFRSGLVAFAAVILGAALYWFAQDPATSVGSDASPTTREALATPAFTPAAPHASSATPAPAPAITGPLWTPGAAVTAPAPTRPGPTPVAVATIALDAAHARRSLPQLHEGDAIDLPLMHGERAHGRVNLVQRESNGILRIAGALDSSPVSPTSNNGSFSLSLAGSRLSGRILLPASRLAYLVESTSAGQTQLTETALSAVLCDPLPRPPEDEEMGDDETAAVAAMSGVDSAAAASAAGSPEEAPPVLSSRPTATAVIYLDFDGEIVTDPDWNNGVTITAAPSYLGDYEITQVWKRVSEDFAPFNVDITTDVSRYNAAPAGSRARCIITPTDQWYKNGTVGGVAYVGSFAGGGFTYSSTIPSWVFNYSMDGIAEAVSHEVGHMLGLSHDGRTSPVEEYYTGHGSWPDSWGSIMGASYYMGIVQWSKGEYPSANNTQDDVAIIANSANGFGFAADEAGNTRTTATPIAVAAGGFSVNGLISSAADTDWYSFTTASGSALLLQANPAEVSPNLDLLVELYDSAGTLVLTVDPQTTLGASVERNLLAGTHYLKVQGTGRGSPLTGGYSKYGSIGRYTLTATLGATASAPTILTQPLSATVTANPYGSFSLSVLATGVGQLTYQWEKDGVALTDINGVSGATTANLYVYNVDANDAGAYKVNVTNFAGATLSNAATLTVVAPPPPTFQSQPYGAARFVGQNFDASVWTESIGAVTYQWLKDGVELTASPRISGLTSSYFSISDLTEADAGSYQVRATNSSGSTLSNAAILTVTMPAAPVVTTHPNNLTVYVGAYDFYLSGNASGNGLLRYQWEKDGAELANATGSSLRVANPKTTDSGRYRLKIWNAGGTVYTHEATVSVEIPPPPVIRTHPQSRAGYLGESSLSFYVETTGNNDGYTYQWQKDGVTLVSGSHISIYRYQLTIYQPAAGDAGEYVVKITNAGGTTTSNAAVLTLSLPPAPVITSDLTDRTVIESESFSWYASFNSSTPLTYQWYKDGVALTGRTSPYFSRYDVKPTDAGVYKVSATNNGGTTFSREATVTVTTAVKPVFLTQPTSVRAYEGSNVSFAATAQGTPSPSYAWTKNGAATSGSGWGGNASLSLNNITANDAGSYAVTATNTAGSTTSTAATLTIVTRASGEALDLSPATKTVGPGRVTYPVRVRTAADWTVEHSAVWLAVSKLSGSFDDTLEITVAPNPHATARTATVTIAGLSHTVTQRAAGTTIRELWSTGRNYYGALGDHAVLDPIYPTQIATNVKNVFAGPYASLVLKNDATLTGLGMPDNYLTTAALHTDIQAASLGNSHGIYLKTDGTLFGIGQNHYGQLSDNTLYFLTAPVQIATQVTAIAAAGDHTLYVTQDGKLWARGSNYYGQLGAGEPTSLSVTTEIATGVSTVVTNYQNTLFLKTDGTAWGMGHNSNNQLGVTAASYQRTPVLLASGVKAIALGEVHSLYLKTDGSVWALGSNSQGQFASTNTSRRTVLTSIASDVKAIAAGSTSTFIVKTDDTLWATGSNYSQLLGFGTSDNRYAFTQGMSDVKKVVPYNNRTFFIRTDDSLWSVGSNYYGESGVGTPAQRKRTAPIQVASDVVSAAAGPAHSLYVTSDGSLWGMGANNYSTLGSAQTGFPSSAPRQLDSNVSSVSTAYTLSLVLKRDNTLWFMGELYPNSTAVPAKVADQVTAFDAGYSFASFVKSDATVWTRGYNDYGQLGQSTTTYANPAAAQAGSNIVATAAGSRHTLFLSTTGTLTATGRNTNGQLGDGTTINRPAPHPIATSVTAIAAGETHSLWVKSDGTLWGAGSNQSSELGTGAPGTNRTTPVQIATGATVTAAGNATTYYLTADKSLWALGKNDFGQLGDATTTSRYTPVKVAANVEALATGDEHLLFIASGDIRLDVARPALTTFSPMTGGPGQTVTLTGTNLTGITEVLFNGIPSPSITATEGNTTQLTVTVPGDSALTSGPITVATFDGIATSVAHFTPAYAPLIASQPASQTVTNGLGISFAAHASGSPAVSYQWQISTDGGSTWANIVNGGAYSGATTRQLDIDGATTAMNGNRFRYIASNSLGTATSEAFALTIAPIQFPRPLSLGFDSPGNLYVADGANHVIQKIDTSARLTVFAGTAQASGSTDGTGTTARFNEPKGLTVAGSTVYVSDTSNSLIRTINASGGVTTLAGSRDNRAHQDGTGTNAWFAAPLGLVRDTAGNLYVADSTSHTIRKITSAGVVTTLAGSPGVSGSADGTGATARFNEPSDLTIGADGHLYVADALNHTIRRIVLTPSVTVTTLAGLPETPGDLDGAGLDAGFRTPRGLTSDAVGNLYVADTGNSAIRKVSIATASFGLVTTLAGDSLLDGNRDATGTDAWFRQPSDVALDNASSLYVADTGNSAIRKINLNTRAVTTMTATSPAPENPGPGTGGGGTTPPPASSGGGGGGGGGGSPSLWFLGALAAVAALRRLQRHLTKTT